MVNDDQGVSPPKKPTVAIQSKKSASSKSEKIADKVVVDTVHDPSAPARVPHVVAHRMRKLTEPDAEVDAFFLEDKSMEMEKYRVRKSLGMSTTSLNKPVKKTVYNDLKLRAYKAGLESDPATIIKQVLYTVLVVLVIGSVFLAYYLLKVSFKFWTIGIVALWLIIGFFILYPVVMFLFKSYFNYRIFRRKLEVEKVLPEFLRLVATNYRSGLPLDKALIKSNRPRFGVFSKEIELMAKTTKVRGDLAVALEIFGKKFDSKILERAMSSISMSVRSGSNVSNLLEEIASNITKMRNMQASMAANVKNYIIFIVVAGIIIAPLMFGMSYTMNVTIDQVKSSMGSDSDSGMSQGTMISGISEDGGMKPEDFDVFAVLMLITNSIISSLVISMIRHGNFQQGIKNIPIFIIIVNILYYIGKTGLLSMLNFV